MRWTADEVRRVAALARLEVDDPTALRMAGELTRILEYVDQLGEVASDRSDGEAGVPRREDRPEDFDPEPVLAASVGRVGDAVCVPTVVPTRA